MLDNVSFGYKLQNDQNELVSMSNGQLQLQLCCFVSFVESHARWLDRSIPRFGGRRLPSRESIQVCITQGSCTEKANSLVNCLVGVGLKVHISNGVFFQAMSIGKYS